MGYSRNNPPPTRTDLARATRLARQSTEVTIPPELMNRYYALLPDKSKARKYPHFVHLGAGIPWELISSTDGQTPIRRGAKILAAGPFSIRVGGQILHSRIKGLTNQPESTKTKETTNATTISET
jgi:hypothetical protein